MTKIPLSGWHAAQILPKFTTPNEIDIKTISINISRSLIISWQVHCIAFNDAAHGLDMTLFWRRAKEVHKLSVTVLTLLLLLLVKLLAIFSFLYLRVPRCALRWHWGVGPTLHAAGLALVLERRGAQDAAAVAWACGVAVGTGSRHCCGFRQQRSGCNAESKVRPLSQTGHCATWTQQPYHSHVCAGAAFRDCPKHSQNGFFSSVLCKD